MMKVNYYYYFAIFTKIALSKEGNETFVSLSNPNQIKVGFFTSHPLLSTSMAALQIALEKIKNENLLPTVTWRLFSHVSQCSESDIVGEVINLVLNNNCSVIVGPPCYSALKSLATVSNFANTTLLNWASTYLDSVHQNQFPTLINSVDPAPGRGHALKEVLLFFNWRTISLIYSDDHMIRKCYSIGKSLEKITKEENITISYSFVVQTQSYNNEIDNFLKTIPKYARIIIACFDDKDDNERFLLRARKWGVNIKDFVFILLNYAENDRNQAKTEAFRFAFSLQTSTLHEEKFVAFKEKISKRISNKNSLNHSIKALDVQTILYSAFLHDCFYLYTLTLNKSNDITGQRIAENARKIQLTETYRKMSISQQSGSYLKWFYLHAYDKVIGEIILGEVIKEKDENFKVKLLLSERVIWEWRGGFRPVDVPPCGFEMENCRNTLMSRLFMGCVFGFPLVFLLAVAVKFYLKKRASKRMSKMWKIHYDDLIFPDQEITTVAFSMSFDEEMELKNVIPNNFAIWQSIEVWTKEHEKSIMISRKEEHDQLKQDVLHHEKLKLDWMFKYSLLRDIAEGMKYLHSSPIQTHGRLRSSNCLITNHWVLKITDYGLFKFRTSLQEAKDLLWRAPELLRMVSPPTEGTQKGDVYSFSIIVQEIVTRVVPYYFDDLSPAQIVNAVANCQSPPFRPQYRTIDFDTHPAIIQLMKDCWKENPELRPNFRQIKLTISGMEIKKVNLMDHALKMMERKAENLEEAVSVRSELLCNEVEKVDIMLSSFLPKTLGDKLKSGQAVQPESFENVTVLSVGVAGFRRILMCRPMEAIKFIEELYNLFDDVFSDYDVCKVETLTDGFMCASGLPNRNGDQHAGEIADVSLLLLRLTKKMGIAHMPEERLRLRFGCHTGPVIAAVVGAGIPRYCLFGETVKIAVGIERTSKSSSIQMSDITCRVLTEVLGGYITKPRGEVTVKKNRSLYTYWLLAKLQQFYRAD